MIPLIGVGFLVLSTSQVTAHGLMNWPISRIQPGDQQNGYTYGRSAANRNTGVHAHPDINCAYLPKGPVFTQVMAPGPATIDYTITAWHQGGCIVYLSRDNQQTWENIGEDPTCGVQSANPTGRGSVNVVIPDGSYQAVLRWYYLADNGGAPNEFFNNCADVVVSPAGTNTHAKVEFLGGHKNFINQCVSLAAGGGWVGGSSWYAYQCPYDATCQSVNGIDTCVGGLNLPQPPVIVPTTSSTNEATTTIVPPSISTTVPSTEGAPCATANELRLPIPTGQSCTEVKHACQTHCTSNQLYNIKYNRCYSEERNSAIQWCQCNGITWYNTAFGNPTKACPAGSNSEPVPAPAPQPETTIATTTIDDAPVPEPESTSTTMEPQPPSPSPISPLSAALTPQTVVPEATLPIYNPPAPKPSTAVLPILTASAPIYVLPVPATVASPTRTTAISQVPTILAAVNTRAPMTKKKCYIPTKAKSN
ncbi:UNVERIFIED_CONTAM: hypothetical protein HDU68_011349 [Siphonaria sp. JEL0065]|nr:hypothetical protein HDU68_011349 [Siphonaria sp. JEL0065]